MLFGTPGKLWARDKFKERRMSGRAGVYSGETGIHQRRGTERCECGSTIVQHGCGNRSLTKPRILQRHWEIPRGDRRKRQGFGTPETGRQELPKGTVTSQQQGVDPVLHGRGVGETRGNTGIRRTLGTNTEVRRTHLVSERFVGIRPMAHPEHGSCTPEFAQRHPGYVETGTRCGHATHRESTRKQSARIGWRVWGGIGKIHEDDTRNFAPRH
mmetsp:Transcript_13707/g.28278  ORF Transcript_13707/g.28278 Transcript_13707/m.28278 type:complete len:213 (+) Transcript_13707:395-1033(+)